MQFLISFSSIFLYYPRIFKSFYLKSEQVDGNLKVKEKIPMSSTPVLNDIAPLETDEEIEMEILESNEYVMTTDSLLVSGYIREMQCLLSKNSIIPNDICGLCVLFYKLKDNLMFWKKWQIPSHGFGAATKVEIRRFGILNVENKSNMNINLALFVKTIPFQ